MALILQKFASQDLLVVISAMGKTTNALERILSLYQSHGDYLHELSLLKEYHHTIMADLFPQEHRVWALIGDQWRTIERNLKASYEEADQRYDQVVSYGEILSTLIVAEYLTHQGMAVEWLDARSYVVTDENYREAIVDWNATAEKVKTLDFRSHKLKITQGFLGKNRSGFTTTLGRDGSDFSAAIFAYCLDAKGVTIWKDVPGVMNADPKRMKAVTLFE
ncbi:MAG TPA: aspartate kinase, partial [Sphingobacteriaceae bacterium]